MFSLQSCPPVVAHVYDDIACVTRGAVNVCAELERKRDPAGSPNAEGGATWLRSQCLGLCERAPAALLSSAGEQSHKRVLAPASAEAVQSLVSDAVAGRMSAEPDSFIVKISVPQAAAPQNGPGQLRLLHRISRGSSGNLEDYRRLAGYEGLRKALYLGPESTLRELSASKLLGRGGA